MAFFEAQTNKPARKLKHILIFTQVWDGDKKSKSKRKTRPHICFKDYFAYERRPPITTQLTKGNQSASIVLYCSHLENFVLYNGCVLFERYNHSHSLHSIMEKNRKITDISDIFEKYCEKCRTKPRVIEK